MGSGRRVLKKVRYPRLQQLRCYNNLVNSVVYGRYKLLSLYACMNYEHTHICMYIYICVCKYIYIYTYVYCIWLTSGNLT